MINDPKAIHETKIRDIIDIITDLKDLKSNVFNGGKRAPTSYSSIAKASNNLTMVFPVIAEEGVSLSAATMICKASERKAAAMLQMLFSALNVSSSSDTFEFIKQFHTNLSDDMDLDEFIDTMDGLKTEGAENLDRTTIKSILEDLKNLDFTLEEGPVNESLGRFIIDPSKYDMPIIETITDDEKEQWQRNRERREENKDRHAQDKADFDIEQDKYQRSRDARRDQYQVDKDRNQSDREDRRDQYQRERDRKRDRYQKTRDDIKDMQDIMRDANRKVSDNNNYYQNQMLDNDIKKANELMPTLMIINFVSTDDIKDPVTGQITRSGVPIQRTSVIGIKAKLQYVSHQDMIDRIIVKNKDKNGLFNFIRATTREISFWKDFVFAVDKAKLDAVNTASKASSNKIWKLLERRAIKSKVRRFKGTINDASAITTMLVSKETVDYLNKEENLNMNNPRTTLTIMEAYNLMAVVIVDEILEKVSFLYDDGSDKFEVISFTNLEKEDKGNYKKVINLLSKAR